MTKPSEPRPEDREIGRRIVERAIGAAPSPTTQGKKPRSHPDRAANLWLGTLFFSAGVGPVGLVAVFVVLHGLPTGSWLWLLLTLSVFGVIALVGLNMLIQGTRNRPGSEGFFYRGLSRIGRRMTPVHATLVPLGLCTLAVLEGVVAKDEEAAKFGAVLGLAWTSTFVQLFLHEIGHLLAVRRVGLPFVRLAAGPVALVPHGRAYRFRANREWLHFVLGAVYYETSELPSARKALFVAMAGPIATAFLGLFALAAEEATRAERGSIAYGVARANVVIAGGTLFTNLLPMRLGRMESDGMQIWLALRSLAGRG